MLDIQICYKVQINKNSRNATLHKPVACRLFPSPLMPSKFVLFPRLKTAVVDGGKCCAPNTNGLLLAVANENEPGCIACWLHVAADWPNSDCVDWKLNDGADDTPNPNEGIATLWPKTP